MEEQSMKPKTYDDIATAIYWATLNDDLEENVSKTTLLEGLLAIFEKDNRFNRDLFLKACRLGPKRF
jgi:hypothetical protein